MIPTRRPARRLALKEGRRADRSRILRRTLFAERLEERAMLTAADWTVSDYFNLNHPKDVNADGRVTPLDALIVINELNRGGSRSLPARGAAEGESGGSQSFFYDVNNDGAITPLDALIIINALNGEGEHGTDMAYRIYALQPDGHWLLGHQINTLTVGEPFDLVITVQDSRHAPPNPVGVFSGFVDVLHDTSKARVLVSELQDIVISGSPEIGSFTLNFNNAPTPATVNWPITGDENEVARRIENALNTLPTIAGVGGSVQVRVEGGGYRVRFTGSLRDTDVPQIVANAANLPGASISVTTYVDGVASDPVAFQEAFKSWRVGPINEPLLVPSYGNFLNAQSQADRFNDVGAGHLFPLGPYPGGGERELVRARMEATSGGMLTFTLDLNDIAGGLDTLLYAREITPNVEPDKSEPLSPSQISLPAPLTLTITADIVANSTTVETPEDTPITVNVIPDLASTTLGGTLQVRSVNKNGASGEVTITPDGNSVVYTPAQDFFGTETFFYTVGIGPSGGPTATGSITVVVTPVNDPPVANDDLYTVDEDQTLTVPAPGVLANDTDVDSDPALFVATLVTNVSNGSLTLNPNGAFTYTPNANFSGTDTFTYTVTDDEGAVSNVATVTIIVEAVNDAPEITIPGSQSVEEGQDLPLSGANAISVFDVDAGVEPIRVTLDVEAGRGTFAVTGSPGVTITGQGTNELVLVGPQQGINTVLGSLVFSAGQPGLALVTITANDQGNTGKSGPRETQAFILIDVETSARPRAISDRFGDAPNLILEGSTNIVLDVMANDLPTPGSQTTLLSFTQPAVGVVTRDDNGTPGDLTDDRLIYNPGDPDFFGTVTFTYTINDTSGTGDDSTGNVTVVITNVNDPPVAVDDAYETDEDTPLTVPAPGVLANDFDVDNNYGQIIDVITVLDFTQPANGTVVLNADGSFTYTPNQDFFGADTFTYRARDLAGAASSPATVTITVHPVNDPPVAVDDTYNAVEDTLLTVPAAEGVLANDFDVDLPPGESLTAILVSQASNGVVTLQSDGSFTYMPNQDFFGTDTFTYQAQDDQGALSNVATVTILVANVNDAPVAVDDFYNAVENVTLNVSAALGVLANDIDVDGDTLTAQLVTGIDPSQGTLTLNANGSFTYVPAPQFFGIVTFTYQAFDGELLSNVATVTINVSEVNDPPTAVNDSYQTDEDVQLVVAAPGVLGNDTDPENDPLTAILVTGVPANQGTLTLNANGSFTFTPAQDFFGVVTFTYKANDGLNDSNVATVTITVNEVNDPPTAVDDQATVFKDAVNVFIDVIANDSIFPDVNETIAVTAVIGQEGSGTSVTTAEGGTARLVGGQVFYDAPQGFVGNDSFQYELTDSRGGVAFATVFITVIDAIPSDVGGRVFIDSNDNGLVDLGEQGVMNVRIHLTGSDVNGNPVNLSTLTDIGGFYFFANVAPGSYRLWQEQPLYLKDGKDTNGGSFSVKDGNDAFLVTLPQQGLPGGAMGNNFAELGIDAGSLADARGLLGEVFASSGQNGFRLATSITGNMIWTWSLPGWTNMKSAQIILDADLQHATLRVTDLAGTVHQIRIHQSPTSNTESNYPSGSMARFRILGWSSTNDYIIRIDGTAADFGLNLLAAVAPAPEAEGEGPVQADREFAEAADALFAEEAWA